MLESLRRIGRTWFGKVLGAFLLVGLAGFGISNVVLNFGSQTVASVGGEEISIRDFQRAYNDDLQRAAQQYGQTPSAQDALALGIPTGTLSRLAAEAAVNRLASQMGIGVSEDRLAKMLKEDPTFAGTLGGFDSQNFNRVLQQMGFTEAEYFNLQTRASRRQQLNAAIFADSPVPKVAEELLSRFTGDKRTIDYFVINAQSVPPVAEPTEEELADYLEEHQSEFRTEETRTIDLMVLSIDTLAAVQDITDADIAAEYERTKDGMVRAEKRTIRQAPLTAEQVTAFQTGKNAGKTFDALVAETGVTVSDMGTLAKSEIIDSALGDAAFNLQQGDFAIIPGAGGQRAVTVTAIEAGGVTSLDEARAQIKDTLAKARARESYTDVLDQVEELRAAFKPLKEIADRFKLPLVPITLTPDGSALAGDPTLPEDQRQKITTSIFAAEQDKLSPTIAISANNNVYFDLTAIEPARDQTLDEVRDKVAAAITDERTREAITAMVEKVLEQLKQGEKFEDVALTLNQFPVLSQPLSRSGDGTAVLNQTVASAAFAGGEGHFGAAANGDGDQVVFRVVEIQPAADTEMAQAKQYLDETTRQSLYVDFMSGLRDEAGMRINQQTLNQILALDTTGQ